MNITNLYDFANEMDLDNVFDDAWSELKDVMRENGEHIDDLDWEEQDTFYVDFLFDYFDNNIEDFNKLFSDFLIENEKTQKLYNDWLVENEIKKQVG